MMTINSGIIHQSRLGIVVHVHSDLLWPRTCERLVRALTVGFAEWFEESGSVGRHLIFRLLGVNVIDGS